MLDYSAQGHKIARKEFKLCVPDDDAGLQIAAGLMHMNQIGCKE